MTPLKQSEANALDRDHRALQRELATWKGMNEPPPLVDPVTNLTMSVAGVPMDAFRTYRLACLEHVQKAIAANRAAWEAL